MIFRLSEPFAPFLAGMVRGIVPAGSPPAGYSPSLGAGPYRVDDFQQDSAIYLSRFPGYYGRAPGIERVVVKFLPDSNVRFLELSKGSVNFVLNGVDPRLLPVVLENERLVMEEAAGSNASYLGFNLRDPVLSDVRVRPFLVLAIVREAIVTPLREAHADPANALLTRGVWAHVD